MSCPVLIDSRKDQVKFKTLKGKKEKKLGRQNRRRKLLVTWISCDPGHVTVAFRSLQKAGRGKHQLHLSILIDEAGGDGDEDKKKMR